MIKSLFFGFVILVSLSFASAQWVEAENFIEVSSAQVGSYEQGCFVASISGMLVSINHPKIGTNPSPIIDALNIDLCRTGGTFPYPQYDVMVAVLNFLGRVL